jgi:hypothetical protein
MEGVISSMFATPFKIAASALVATLVLAVPGVLAYQGIGGTAKPGVQVVVPEQVEQKPEAATTNEQPPTAAGRATPEAEICEEALNMIDQLVKFGNESPSVEKIYLWSRRLVEANSAPTVGEATRRAALDAHLARMNKVKDIVERLAKNGQATAFDVLEAKYRVLEATRWVTNAKIVISEAPVSAKASTPNVIGTGGFGGGGAFGGDAPERDPLVIEKNPGDDKQNQAILAILGKPIPLDFGSETSLEEVRKFLISKTIDEAAGLPNGIPIYFDPEGLQDADKTMKSTIQISIQDVPLRTSLRLLLRQVGLNYRVVGGLLLISDEESIQVQERMARGRRPITPEK